MKAALLRNGPYGKKLVRDFGKSLREAGVEVFDCVRAKSPRPKQYDIAVGFGLCPKSTATHNIIIETGYLHRGLETGPDDVLFSIGYERILDLPTQVTVEGTKRWQELSRRFPDDFPEYVLRQTSTGPVLLIGQLPRDKSHKFKTIQQNIDWLRLRCEGEENVVYRPHPRLKEKRYGSDSYQNEKYSFPSHWHLDTSPSFEECLSVFAPKRIVTFCSTAGLYAKCAGYDVVSSPDSWYYGVDGVKAATLCAQSTFTRNELADGTALRFLVHHIQQKHHIDLSAIQVDR